MIRRSNAFLAAAVPAAFLAGLGAARADIGFVTNVGNGTGTTVNVFDTFSNAQLPGSPVTVGTAPFDIWGYLGKAFVTNYASNNVTVIDAFNLTTLTNTEALPSGFPIYQPTGMSAHNTNYMAFTDRVGQNNNAAPQARILFIGLQDPTVRDEIAINVTRDEYPNDLISTGNNDLWFTDGRSVNGRFGIWKYDGLTGPPFGSGVQSGQRIESTAFNVPYRMWYDAEIQQIYVCNYNGNSVVSVDRNSGTVTGEIAIGGAGQTDIAVIGDTVYVAMRTVREVRRFRKSDPTNLLPAITGFTTDIFGLGVTGDGYLYVGSAATGSTVYLVDVTVDPPAILDTFTASDTGWTEFFFFAGGAGVTGAGLGTGVTNNTNIVGADRHDDGRSVNRNLGAGGATHHSTDKDRKFFNCYLDAAGGPAGRAAGGAVLLLLGAALAAVRRRRI